MRILLLVILILTVEIGFTQNQNKCNCEIRFEEDTTESIFKNTEIYSGRGSKEIINRIISIENDQILIGYMNDEVGEIECHFELIDKKMFIDIGAIGESNEEYTIVQIAENPKYQELLITFPHQISMQFKYFLNNKEIKESDLKYKTYPEKFSIVGKDTINRVDTFGLKQGIWILEDTSNIIMKERIMTYQDGIMIQGKEIERFPNDTIKEINYLHQNPAIEDSISQIQYYRSGKILEIKYTIDSRKEGDSFRKIFYENGNIVQDFIYTGSKIKLIGYYENGQIEYEGLTLIGTEYFDNGPIIEYSSWKSKINCKYWLENGEFIGMKELEFMTLDLTNINERNRRRTKFRRQ